MLFVRIFLMEISIGKREVCKVLSVRKSVCVVENIYQPQGCVVAFELNGGKCGLSLLVNFRPDLNSCEDKA